MNIISKGILEDFNRLRPDYVELGDVVHNCMDELVKSAGLSILGIEHRIKTEKSLAGKLERKGGDYYHSIDDLTDLMGIRIICFYADEVDIVGKLVGENFAVDWDNSIDKREIIKEDTFGYLSLHYICYLTPDMGYKENICNKRFEIQIRTNLQHTWSVVHHDFGYKTDFGVPRVVARQFARLAGLLELADDEFVSIREHMKSYTEDIRQKIIEGCANDIQIDLISLTEYINKNQTMRGFLVELSNACKGDDGQPAEIREITPESYILQLKWLGITNLGEMQNLVNENMELALKMAKATFENTDLDILSTNAALRYLCHACLINRDYTRQQAEEFFKLSTNNYKRAERMANNLFNNFKTLS